MLKQPTEKNPTPSDPVRNNKKADRDAKSSLEKAQEKTRKNLQEGNDNNRNNKKKEQPHTQTLNLTKKQTTNNNAKTKAPGHPLPLSFCLFICLFLLLAIPCS